MVFVLIMLAIVLTVDADRTGCCCKDNQAYRGSFVRESVCTSEAQDYNFAVPPSDFVIGRATSTICNEYCRETAAMPEVTINECGSEGYVPKPENIQLKPTKGQRKLALNWINNCTDYITHYEISRCHGDCAREDFTVQTTATNFSDQSGLEWGKAYTYRIKTLFSFGGQSDEASITNSPGDLECQGQGTNSFCISLFYYLELKEYLKTYGYKGTDKRLFNEPTFNQTRNTNFGANYNNAFRCDDYNRLSNILTCQPDKACIASGTTATCADRVSCKEQASATPFGLYSTLNSCEGTQPKKYCYYDKSYSLVNDCFNCDSAMRCYDYRTSGGCERDNCGVGSCEWHDSYPMLGIGVCVDTRFDNCELCNQQGNFNVEAYNDIFDRCTPTKARALETSGHPCFYNPSDGSSGGCAAVSCLDYSSSDQCAAPSGGIQLNQNNNITQKSNDPCGIGVCQYDTTTQMCAKNANGQIDGTVFMDCYSFYTSGDYKNSRAVKQCELDYFPPKTEFIPVSQKIGIVNYFNIRVLDKKSFTEDFGYITKAERQSYPTYFCIYSGRQCTNFNLSTVNDKLIVDNLILGEKTARDVTAIAVLAEGQNTIRYYTKDPNENLEEIKEIRFNACNGCQGPTLVEYNFSHAREVEGIYYTKMPTPSAGVLFSTETTLTTKEIIGMNRIIGTTSQTINKKFHTLTAASALVEGSYKLKVNGVNQQNIAMDAPVELPFVYDASAPTVRIIVEDQPAGGKIFEKSNVRLKLEFSETTILEEVTIVKPDIGDYAILGDNENLTLTLTTTNNIIYTGTLNLPEGPNQIKVHAVDYAGNHLFDAATFNIFTAAPSILLKSPSYGVSATPNFNLVVETSNPATCRFWFNAETPAIPAPATYELLEAFTTTGALSHSKESINRISADKEKQPYQLTVKCQSKYGPIFKEFQIMFDTTLPKIINAGAYPNPVIQLPYETHLKVTTTPLTFCKYDREQKSFAQMPGTFPGYAKIGQTNHQQLLTLENLGNYTYYISCITLAELGPATEKVTFSVRAGVAFNITSKTPGYTETTTIPLSLETNKDALCYYSITSGTIGNLIGDGTGAVSHSTSAIGNTGKNQYFITCTTTGRAVINGTPESKKINITVYAVELPPEMEQNKTALMSSQCSNGIMDGDETTTDCGGSCLKCAEGEQCQTDADCIPTFSCIQHPQTGFKICAGAELLRTFEKLRDSDNDGLPDWWEEKYFGDKTIANPDDDPDKDGLTNLEEYRYYEKIGNEISPVNWDSDGDGWSDGKEIQKESNPFDINVHPPSLWWIWLIIILLLLVSFLTTSYVGYKIFGHKKGKKTEMEQQQTKKAEAKKQLEKSWQKIAAEASRIKEALTPKKEDYPLITELSEDYLAGAKSEKERVAGIFIKLQNFLEGKPIERLERGEAIEKLRKLKQGGETIKEPFETLIKLAVDRYPKEERLALLKKLQLLRAGLLSDSEREELFRKLREIAKYWETHKELLRREIQKWLKSKPFHFIKPKKTE